MELAERYAYRVYLEKSFTTAAKALYISQPGLSAMIGKLEKKLGFQIFDRSTAPLSLTSSGRIYMDYLQNVIAEESNMMNRIRQLSETQSDALSVCVFSQTAYYLFAPLCARFSALYPEVSVTADIGNNGSVELLADKLKNNMLDAILTDSFSDTGCLSIPVFKDRILIAVNKKLCPEDLLISHALTREDVLSHTIEQGKLMEDISLLKDVPFLSFDNQVTTAQIVSEIFRGNYMRSSYHIKNSKNLMMHYYMMREGLGATIADASHLPQPVFDDPDIVYFAPKSPLARRTLYCVIREERADEPLLKNFLAFIMEFFKEFR